MSYTDRYPERGIESPLGPLLYKAYGKVPYSLSRFVMGALYRREGGQLHSHTLRRIMQDHHGVEIGLYSDGGCFRPAAFDSGTIIGRYCSIAETATAWGANHPMNAKSSHALFYNPALGLVDEDGVERTKLVIGHDVWLGHNSIILSGVESIGTGAVVGAGSVVHKDVPPYAVVVGHPARVVRYRFSDEKIADLLAEQWWERPLDDLVAAGIGEFRRPLEGDLLR